MSVAADLLVHPIGELATAVSSGTPLHGAEMDSIVRIQDAALAVRDGRIVAVGPAADILPQIELEPGATTVDASGRLVIPGLVDPHTHLVFAGNRANEFLMRCQGKSYQEIAQAGGGIVASTRATRQATVDELVSLGLERLRKLLSFGTTSCEVKTGYGLSAESELNMLAAVLRLQEMQPVELVPTFMPAHAFPPDYSRAEYMRSIVSDMLPAAAKVLQAYTASGASPVFQDVFCDQGYFNLQETRDILEAGLKHGLRPKIHADEFVNLGASSLAVEIGAASADHLLNISDAEIELMAASDTVAVLLPGTSFFLNLKEHARARAMIDRGVAVALGSDFNPGSCHIFSLPFIWGLACLQLKMSVSEALTALTVNSACAIGLGGKIGQLNKGYQADFLILNLSKLEEVPYNLGSNPVGQVFKSGKSVLTNS
ncbi:MAG: imidazolonepropionase [Candidatus Obscuribacterales bacterium]|nr:imidazolonepropionase [Candidatus Obscuribacterales bacterium]